MKSESEISKDLYERIIDVMPYGVMVANPQGEFILWNKRARLVFPPILRTSKQEDWVDDFGVFSIDKKDKYNTEDLQMSRAMKGEVVIGEKIFVRSKGYPSGIYLKVSSYPVLSEDKKSIEAAIIVFEDITKEQKIWDNIIDKISELESELKKNIAVNRTMVIEAPINAEVE